ncbi:serine hydrolase domain-containing protein [Pseudoalteromonas denitrificans]|uniref:CubicO group peptidase, beta-lactamase class C family n=1 Tax=Pseudoalteromonas denitrificans DSM 6059 TaxID=1123010 RepID=A0A1I1TNL4_9GAMM|nr:serine hydrolase domain-containing protein [Pseudoalteromonas denitrificans]SFD60241.1 CubicO group peptidase, beta-lactamase class C family [Pseudoalteromonas denitrificans DSM 6059]
MKLKKVMLLSIVYLSVVGTAVANEQLSKKIEQFLNKKQLPGMETLIIKDGKTWHHSAIGNINLTKKNPLNKDSIFRIYSMTKPVTAVALLQLVEQGKLTLDSYIQDHLPQLLPFTYNGNHQKVTIRQLLSHTAGFGYDFPLLHNSKTQEDLLSGISGYKLNFKSGDKWAYSLASDIQGALIESISGEPLDVYLAKNIFNPLGMKDTSFWVSAQKSSRLVDVYKSKKDMVNLKTLASEDVAYLTQTKFLSAGGGLVSTATDYGYFLTMLMNQGKYKGKNILSESLIKMMLTSNTQGLDTGFLEKIYPNSGFGFGLGIKEKTGDLRAKGSIYWAGKGGTFFWVDPKHNLIVVAMMQAENAWPKVNAWLGKEVYSLL